MFITKKALPRRTFLRGMGAAVSLPLLESMVPALTALAKTPASPSRAGFVYVPHGAIMKQWTPTSEGVGFELSPTLKPLEPFQDQLLVVSNLARPGLESTANHATTASGWLSGVKAKRTEAEDVRLGTTIDQVIAKKIGQDTPFPSIEVATENFEGYIGACSIGYSCAYMNTLSWATPTTPLPMEINPRVVFERMFGRAGTNEQRLAQMREDRSILDSLSEDVKKLERGLDSRDRARLSEYLDNIREIERRIQRTEAQNHESVTPLDTPIGVPDAFREHAEVMFQLLAVAYQADLTRVFSFMMNREASQRTYPELGISEPHHSLSHHGNDPAKVAQNVQINVHYMQLFAKFLETLKASPDGDGSVLDHSLIFYGSGMSNSNAHTADPLPLLAVGGGVGKGHRHIITPDKTPVGNMWLSVAHKFDSPMDSFGESTGAVSL